VSGHPVSSSVRGTKISQQGDIRADLDMRGVDVAVRIGPAWSDAYSVVIVRDDIFEPVLLAVTFQRRNHALGF